MHGDEMEQWEGVGGVGVVNRSEGNETRLKGVVQCNRGGKGNCARRLDRDSNGGCTVQ